MFWGKSDVRLYELILAVCLWIYEDVSGASGSDDTMVDSRTKVILEH